MSDQQPNTPPPDWRDMRRQDKWQRHQDRHERRQMMWGPGGGTGWWG